MDLISALVGRNFTAVEHKLGPAEKQESVTGINNNQWIKACFRRETITVVFIGGIADWIMVTDEGLAEEFSKTMGLHLNKPSYIKHQEAVRYFNIHGLKEVAFFKDDADRIIYVNIKAFTG